MSIKTKIFYLHFIGAANQTILAQHCMTQRGVNLNISARTKIICKTVLDCK